MSDHDLPTTRAEDDDPDDREEASSVLEVFGFELKVRNKRLAEVLRMDAREALNSSVRDLLDPREVTQVTQEAAQAVLGAVVRPASPREAEETRKRSELRERANALGDRLGFHVADDGMWRSPSGIAVVTRVVTRDLNPRRSRGHRGQGRGAP